MKFGIEAIEYDKLGTFVSKKPENYIIKYDALSNEERKRIEEFADNSSVPVINALSDQEHPCQALGDILTIKEKSIKLEQCIISLIGDGNNV